MGKRLWVERNKDGSWDAFSEDGAHIKFGKGRGQFTPGDLMKVALAGCAALSSQFAVEHTLGDGKGAKIVVDGTYDADTDAYIGFDEQVVIDAINRVLCQKDDFLQTLRANIATVVLQGDVLSPEVIDERLSKLQKELLKKINQKDDYDAIADEILRLRDQRRQAEVDSVIKDEQMKQIRDLQDFVKNQPSTITEFDETLVSRLIAKITVFDDHFTVEFKSGITINIEA